MITLRHTVSALAVSTLLFFPACKKKDGESATNTVNKVIEKNLKGKNVSASQLDPYFKVKKRNSTSGDEALKALGMEDDESVLSWNSRDGDTGNYVFKQVRLKSARGDNMAIDRMELKGVRMEGGDPTFDVMSVSGLNMTSEQGKGEIGSIQIAQPHPDVAAKILPMLNQLNEMKDFDLDIDLDMDLGGEPAFGAIMIEDVAMNEGRGSLTLDVIGWASDEKTDKGKFLISDLDFSSTNEKDITAGVSIKTFSANGINKEVFNRAMSGDSGPIPINPGNLDSGNLIIDDVTINADALKFNLDGLRSSVSESGGVITESMVLDPMRITLEDGGPASAEYADVKKIMRTLDLSEIVLSGGATRIKNSATGEMQVKNATLTMRDGFDLNLDLDMIGLAADPSERGALTLRQGNIEFTDNGFVDTAFAFYGSQFGDGMSGKDLRKQAAAVLTVASFAGQAPADITTPVTKFLNDGGTLKANIDPKEPLPTELLMSPAMLQYALDPGALKDLGVSFEHEK